MACMAGCSHISKPQARTSAAAAYPASQAQSCRYLEEMHANTACSPVSRRNTEPC